MTVLSSSTLYFLQRWALISSLETEARLGWTTSMVYLVIGKKSEIPSDGAWGGGFSWTFSHEWWQRIQTSYKGAVCAEKRMGRETYSDPWWSNARELSWIVITKHFSTTIWRNIFQTIFLKPFALLSMDNSFPFISQFPKINKCRYFELYRLALFAHWHPWDNLDSHSDNTFNKSLVAMTISNIWADYLYRTYLRSIAVAIKFLSFRRSVIFRKLWIASSWRINFGTIR